MTKRLEAISDSGRLAGSVPTVQIHLRDDVHESLNYVLGLTNSKLLNWYYDQLYSSLSLAGGYLRIGVPQISELRIKRINANDPSEKGEHDRLVSLVDTMLSLHKRFAAEQLPQRREQVQREIDATDRQMDQLVYQLYGLTDDEIAIVEAATR